QQGWHGEKRQTWGHAGTTDSRGQILSMIEYEGNSLITVPFDLAAQELVLTSMPFMMHR
ncbi:carbon-nitrogen hydrolase family protein, partial [Acinetobacter baumannii]